MIPKSQIITVLHTSAKDRETGEINFDTVTAIGTEIPIEIINPILRSKSKVLSVI